MLNPDMLKLRDELFILISNQLQQIQDGELIGSFSEGVDGFNKTYICQDGGVYKFVIEEIEVDTFDLEETMVGHSIRAIVEKSRSSEF